MEDLTQENRNISGEFVAVNEQWLQTAAQFRTPQTSFVQLFFLPLPPPQCHRFFLMQSQRRRKSLLFSRFSLADTHRDVSYLNGSNVSVSQSPDKMNSSNLSTCNPADTSANIFFMSIYSLMFLVGLFLNGFTLKVYFCGARHQPSSSSVTIYLKNLVAADFLISLCLPMRIIKLSDKSVLFLHAHCNFGASAFYLNMYASILFMGYIAANRYLKIVHPLGTHILQTVRAAHIISTVTWGLLLTLAGTYILLSVLMQGAQTSSSTTTTCDELHSPEQKVFYQIIHSFCGGIFLFVLICLVFFYHTTSRRLLQQKQLASSSSRMLIKSRRTMLVLVIVFCVCFVPYHLVRLPYAFSKSLLGSRSQCFFYLKELTVVLSALNVCLDPLIYFIFCKAFRAQMSLRRVFSTTQNPTQVLNTEKRSSDWRLGSIRINKRLSINNTN
ncbi:P2Y purinoceptor 14-like [Xenentodon cancila]